MPTLREHIKTVQELAEKYPQLLDKPLIYSVDDEGNAYHQVINDACPTQVEDINERYLEVVGFYGDTDSDIAIEDCNCVIIN